MPGLIWDATWMMTASVIEEVTQIRSPNVSVAQRRISPAGASARACAASATSFSMRCGSSSTASSYVAVELTAQLLFRQSVAGNCGCSYDSANPHRRFPAARGPLRRSTGSRTARPGRCGRSREILIARPDSPLRERLVWLLVSCKPAEDPFYVVRKLIGGRLQPPDLTSEPRGRAVAAGQAAPQVDLEPLHLLAVRSGDQRALQPDVRGLDAGTGVGAAVHVDRDRLGEVGQPPLQLADQVAGARLGLDDGQLAELDAGARHRVPAERARVHLQAGGLELGHQVSDLVGG